MPEKSENEASKTGQDAETPENGAPATSEEGYRESEEHVPDPTAMSGTLETSGTGGGHNERLTGTTRVFGDVEEISRRVESIISERVQAISDEVRSLLLQHEASAQAVNIPQQTVEADGLPSHQGNIISPDDRTGAASDAERSGNVGGATGAGSPDDVSAGHTGVQDPAQGDSYGQQVIAGGQNPNDGARQHPESEETEAEAKDGEKSEGDKTDAEKYVDTVKERISNNKSAPVKKTAAPRRNGSNSNKKP